MPYVVAVVIVVAIAYGAWQEIHLEGRRRKNLCPRCGRTPAAEKLPGGPADLLVCSQCATRTGRNYRTAYLFLLCMTGLFIMIVVLGTAFDVMQGHSLNWGMLALGTLSVAGMLFLHQRFDDC
jgi:hypothetical protein